MKGLRNVAVTRSAACLAGLLAVGVYALYIHRDALFWHLDGYMVRQTIEGQFRWLGASMALGLDPLRGPGTLFFPVNFRLLPVISIQQMVFAGQISRVLTYTGYADPDHSRPLACSPDIATCRCESASWRDSSSCCWRCRLSGPSSPP